MWDTTFDITGVRAGSLRMPYNDKVHKAPGRMVPEGRPLLPVGLYRFTFADGAGVCPSRGALRCLRASVGGCGSCGGMACGGGGWAKGAGPLSHSHRRGPYFCL